MNPTFSLRRPARATLLFLALAGAVAGGLGGCGSGASPANRTAVRPAAAPAGTLTRPVVSRELGNGFRVALGRLAIMDQQSDEASDLVADLPTGTLRDVHCVDVARPTRLEHWRCSVAWRTASGTPLTLRYAVRAERGACYVAAARPARPTRYDPTIRSYAEDPLNVLASARRGC
ncbi:MAG: hypothetical protein JWO02_2646 [Solirubrobacterales bacterium]|nr:hypothetical protein [Solirubrobacterales bacterium]